MLPQPQTMLGGWRARGASWIRWSSRTLIESNLSYQGPHRATTGRERQSVNDGPTGRWIPRPTPRKDVSFPDHQRLYRLVAMHPFTPSTMIACFSELYVKYLNGNHLHPQFTPQTRLLPDDSCLHPLYWILHATTANEAAEFATFDRNQPLGPLLPSISNRIIDHTAAIIYHKSDHHPWNPPVILWIHSNIASSKPSDMPSLVYPIRQAKYVMPLHMSQLNNASSVTSGLENISNFRRTKIRNWIRVTTHEAYESSKSLVLLGRPRAHSIRNQFESHHVNVHIPPNKRWNSLPIFDNVTRTDAVSEGARSCS